MTRSYRVIVEVDIGFINKQTTGHEGRYKNGAKNIGALWCDYAPNAHKLLQWGPDGSEVLVKKFRAIPEMEHFVLGWAHCLTEQNKAKAGVKDANTV